METKGRLALDEKIATRPPTQGMVIFVSHARLPQSLAGSHASPVVSVEMEADMATGIISRAAVTGIPGIGARLLVEVLAGRNLKDGPQEVVDEIRRRYVCPSHKALCTAVINAYEAHHRHQQQQSLTSSNLGRTGGDS